MAIGRKIPLVQALEILSKKNIQSKEANITMNCSYQLIYEEDEIYQSTISFPKENFNLFQSIEQDMLDLNNGTLNQETEEFLMFLAKIFPKNIVKLTNNDIKEYEPKQVIEKPKKVKKTRQPINQKLVAKILVSVVLFFVVGFGVVYSVQHFSRAEKPKEVTYDTLIEEQQYLEAGKKYPKKIEAIENLLYEKAITSKKQEALDTLSDFNTSYPTIFGEFDLGIVINDYKQALETYEKNSDAFKKEQERLTLVGYCYLKENNLDKAKEISKTIDSVELEKKIFEYTQLSIEIEELEKQLSELEKGGSKNKDQAQKIAEQKFDLMEKRLNL